MQRASFITTEKEKFFKEGKPVLIIDKVGIIGNELSEKFSRESSVVYVSTSYPQQLSSKQNIIHIPYFNKLPSIPQHSYSYIFIVDDSSRKLRDVLPEFAKKAEKDNSQLIFMVHIDDIKEKAISEIVNKSGLKPASDAAKIIIYGDIFSNEKIHDYKTSQLIVNKFMGQTRRFGEIKIMGDGLKKTYPLFLEDALNSILEISFGSHAFGPVFYLFPKHPPTQISLAHMIQKANPNVRIDFIKTKKKETGSTTFPPNGKYLLDDNYPLQARIRKIFLKELAHGFSNGTNGYSETKKNNYNLLPLFGLLYLIFILLLPLITTLFFSFLGFKTLNSAKEEIDRGRLVNAEKLINFSKTYFFLAEKILPLLLIEGKIAGKEKSLESITRNIRLGEDASRGGAYFIESLNKFSKVFMNQSKNRKSDFLEAETSFRNSIVLFQKILAEDKLPSGVKTAIRDFDPLIRFAAGAIDILPNIFGFEGARTYLILFQNNMELRPGGGLIGSYGLLTINEGIVKDFSIHDAYDIDSQLKGHVEPPYALRRYLPINHWYLRDSNFDIDFVKSASRSAFFLEVATGKKADGVVGVNLPFVKNLISAIGPIYLKDYKQLVDKNNLFELTKSHVEKNFFPGSKQKRDFLRSLYRAILLDISQKKNFPYLSLAKVVSGSLFQKHLLFASATPTIQDLFIVNNWSSSLWDKRIEEENIINDFIGINEANLGANKANFFLKRKISKNVTLDTKGKILGELSIIYDNTASNGWLDGDYKNYLRIILQKDAELLSLSIDGVNQKIVGAITDPQIYEAKKFVPPNGIEVEKTEEDGKTIYGFLVNIPSGKTQTITVRHSSLYKKASLKEYVSSYNLRFFKQPGTDEYPFELTLSYPLGYHPIKISEGFREKQGKIFMSKILNSDYEILIILAKQ